MRGATTRAEGRTSHLHCEATATAPPQTLSVGLGRAGQATAAAVAPPSHRRRSHRRSCGRGTPWLLRPGSLHRRRMKLVVEPQQQQQRMLHRATSATATLSWLLRRLHRQQQQEQHPWSHFLLRAHSRPCHLLRAIGRLPPTGSHEAHPTTASHLWLSLRRRLCLVPLPRASSSPEPQATSPCP